MQGALSGLKVLDLSRLLPGPFCSMLMADLGADVIKVEDPKMGDYIRWWPPKIGVNSGFHVVLNRNKRSLTLNLKHPEAKVIFEKLAAGADVGSGRFSPRGDGKTGTWLQKPRADKPAPGLLRNKRLWRRRSPGEQNGPRCQLPGLERGPFLQRQRHRRQWPVSR